MSEIKTKLGTKFVKEAIENDDFYYCNRSKAEKCAQIAENFAIGFAKWCRRNQTINDMNVYSYKELLEIYKKTL